MSATGEASLESVISTDELIARPSRPPNYEVEHLAMAALTRGMDTSGRILASLVETALALCGAQSAGISLLEADGKLFRCPAVAGLWAGFMGGGTPRDFGPCRTVLDRNEPMMFSHPERHFGSLAAVTPGVEEAMLVPFYAKGRAVGTIWVVAHDPSARFEAEDLRLLLVLGQFASAAYIKLVSLNAIEEFPVHALKRRGQRPAATA